MTFPKNPLIQSMKKQWLSTAHAYSCASCGTWYEHLCSTTANYQFPALDSSSWSHLLPWRPGPISSWTLQIIVRGMHGFHVRMEDIRGPRCERDKNLSGVHFPLSLAFVGIWVAVGLILIGEHLWGVSMTVPLELMYYQRRYSPGEPFVRPYVYLSNLPEVARRNTTPP